MGPEDCNTNSIWLIFADMANCIDSGPGEVRQVFIKMWICNSFSLGSSCIFKRVAVGNGREAHGSGSFTMTPGLDVQDAAALRECRYHLDSTLRGLGTEYVKSMCHKYRSTLSNVMIDRDLDETPESYNLNGIADLSFGQEIHRFVSLAGNKIQYMLHNRRDGGKRRKRPVTQQIAKSKLPTKISGAAAVLEREAARMRDIKVKKRRLEQQLGLLEKAKETELEEMESSGDEDMPDLSLRGSLDYLQHVGMPSSSD